MIKQSVESTKAREVFQLTEKQVSNSSQQSIITNLLQDTNPENQIYIRGEVLNVTALLHTTMKQNKIKRQGTLVVSKHLKSALDTNREKKRVNPIESPSSPPANNIDIFYLRLSTFSTFNILTLRSICGRINERLGLSGTTHLVISFSPI